MKGYRQPQAGEGKHARGQARSWAKVLLTRLMQDYPDANEFSVRLIVNPDRSIDAEVTVSDPA